MTTPLMRDVRTVTAADGDAVSAVLAGAFADDPVFTWMIPDPARRSQLLPAFFALFTEAFVPLGVSEVVVGRDAITGAALWAPPGQQAIATRTPRSSRAGSSTSQAPTPGGSSRW